MGGPLDVREDELDKPSLVAHHLEELRLLHEQLSKFVRKLDRFFGFQLLGILSISCVIIPVGFYATIVHLDQGITNSGNSRSKLIIWGMEMHLALVMILIILFSGQIIINSSSRPAGILHKVKLEHLDFQAETQVIHFLNKLSTSPTQITGFRIIVIKMSLVASFTTNVITYFLVLVQFKLSNH